MQSARRPVSTLAASPKGPQEGRIFEVWNTARGMSDTRRVHRCRQRHAHLDPPGAASQTAIPIQKSPPKKRREGSIDSWHGSSGILLVFNSKKKALKSYPVR